MAESQPRIPTPGDLMGPWRQMAEQAEQQWNQFFNQAMNTEQFATMMSRYMEGYLTFQQSLAQNVERYMQGLNLPTRNDITALGERLATIESQISVLAAEQPLVCDLSEDICCPHDEGRCQNVGKQRRGDKSVDLGNKRQVLQESVAVHEPDQHDGNSVADINFRHRALHV